MAFVFNCFSQPPFFSFSGFCDLSFPFHSSGFLFSVLFFSFPFSFFHLALLEMDMRPGSSNRDPWTLTYIAVTRRDQRRSNPFLICFCFVSLESLLFFSVSCPLRFQIGCKNQCGKFCSKSM